MFTIQKGVPIPEIITKRKRTERYSFENMMVGDSFLYSTVKTEGRQRYLGNAARNWAKYRKNGWKFTVRQTDEGIRIWRIK